MERSRLLAQLTDELETVKAEMEERGICVKRPRLKIKKIFREFNDRWIPSGEHPEKSGEGEVRDHRDGRQDWSCRAQPTSGSYMCSKSFELCHFAYQSVYPLYVFL